MSTGVERVARPARREPMLRGRASADSDWNHGASADFVQRRSGHWSFIGPKRRSRLGWLPDVGVPTTECVYDGSALRGLKTIKTLRAREMGLAVLVLTGKPHWRGRRPMGDWQPWSRG
jgi:hypothetical protein